MRKKEDEKEEEEKEEFFFSRWLAVGFCEGKKKKKKVTALARCFQNKKKKFSQPKKEALSLFFSFLVF